MSSNNITTNEFIKKIFKYLIEGFAISLVITLIFEKKRTGKYILLFGLTAASLFAILDLYTPIISNFARQGTGIGLGFNLTGVSNIMPMPIPGLP